MVQLTTEQCAVCDEMRIIFDKQGHSVGDAGLQMYAGGRAHFVHQLFRHAQIANFSAFRFHIDRAHCGETSQLLPDPTFKHFL